ncbi:TPA: hypothetical protein DCE37_14810 [Candidatus Latescibacteria bacterium]|nr:hypothetical protein [Candidatus Latescibacterota bacterium]
MDWGRFEDRAEDLGTPDAADDDAHMAEAAAKLRNRLKQKPDSAMDTLWTPPEIGTESQREAQS